MSSKVSTQVSPSPYSDVGEWKRARGILAKSFYRELKAAGLDARQVIELSRELLELVSEDFRSRN